MIKIAAFTGGLNVPSARFRVRQYVEKLADFGIGITEYSAPLTVYPPKNKVIRPIWGVSTLASRLPSIMRSYCYDVTLLQRGMLSTFATLEFLTKRPRVLDVDDAIWLCGSGRLAPRLAQLCDGVICGNSFLAEQFARWNSCITIIPTGVDTKRYIPAHFNEDQVIGWSGMSGAFKYLYNIEPALNVVLEKVPGARLRIISDKIPAFRRIPQSRIDFIRWSPANEVSAIQGMAVGIMPLEDSPWEKGKCSYKMLLYMACGIPVVVSPVGMNVEVLSNGRVGLVAQTNDDWIQALMSLLDNTSLRIEMGQSGRQTVLNNYSIDVIAPKLAATLMQFE